jgi:hypothetical protein
LREIVALEQERLAARAGEPIGEAIAEVEPGRMAAPLAEIAIGCVGDLGLLGGDRFDDDSGLGNGFVEAPAGDRAPRAIDDDGGFEIVSADIRLCSPVWLSARKKRSASGSSRMRRQGRTCRRSFRQAALVIKQDAVVDRKIGFLHVLPTIRGDRPEFLIEALEVRGRDGLGQRFADEPGEALGERVSLRVLDVERHFYFGVSLFLPYAIAPLRKGEWSDRRRTEMAPQSVEKIESATGDGVPVR